MIVSHRHKLIFIKTMKTAGTSIEVFLGQHRGPDDIITAVFPKEEGHKAQHHKGRFNPLPELLAPSKMLDAGRKKVLADWDDKRRFWNHMPAQMAKARLPQDIWDGYLKVCVERDPIDKTRSHFDMEVARGHVPDLDAYFEREWFPSDWYRYADRKDQILVDRVIRYENLNQELGALCEELGIPWEGSLGVKAKAGHSKRSDKLPFEPSEAQRDQLRKAFAREVDAFGYTI